VYLLLKPNEHEPASFWASSRRRAGQRRGQWNPERSCPGIARTRRPSRTCPREHSSAGVDGAVTMLVSAGTVHRTARQDGDRSQPGKDRQQSPSHGPGGTKAHGHGAHVPRDPQPLATGLSGREADRDLCPITKRSVDRPGRPRGPDVAQRPFTRPSVSGKPGTTYAREPHGSTGLVSGSLSQSAESPTWPRVPPRVHRLAFCPPLNSTHSQHTRFFPLLEGARAAGRGCGCRARPAGRALSGSCPARQLCNGGACRAIRQAQVAHVLGEEEGARPRRFAVACRLREREERERERERERG
jgi:hypothetical protein